MKKTIHIRDIPLGILLITIALYFVYGAIYFSGFPSFIIVLAIFLCVILTNAFLRAALVLILGKEFEIDESKE